MDPQVEPEAESGPEPILPDPNAPQPAQEASSNRRLMLAMAAYAILALLAALRLDGRLRIVVWLALGLFAFRTILSVLKQKTD